MFIKDIEGKIRLTRFIALASFVSAILIAIGSGWYSYKTISKASENIYILDHGIPIVASRTNVLDNRLVERKSHINYFHNLFFTLSPDNKYIESQIKKALYLIDESGFNEQVNLTERGFYSSILSSNSVMTIEADSIVLNKEQNHFKYYGKQTITRRTAIIMREFISEGYLVDVPRSENNSHGVLIQNWKILSNKTLSEKRNY